MSDEVLVKTKDNIGIIAFNREKHVNALKNDMAAILRDYLKKWQRDKKAVIIKADKNFSSGGDIKIVWEKEYKGPKPIYKAIYEIYNSTIPVIAIMNGITMGAGLGIAVFARFRIATDDTVAAMPEVKVGMLPDVGGSFFLPRLKYNLGYYMGLTGSSLEGRDVQRAGLATHFIPKEKLQVLEDKIAAYNTFDELERAIVELSDNDHQPPMIDEIRDVDHCFGGDSVEEILERLERVNNVWSSKTIASIKAACPGSVKIAFKSLRTGRDRDFRTCLLRDYALVYWSLQNHDFREGVRAILFEKDHKPRWNPRSLSEVTEEYVDGFFRIIPDPDFHMMLEPISKL